MRDLPNRIATLGCGRAGGKSRAGLRTEASETNAMPDPVLSPGLYLTATPIGNAADITLRALNVLRNCDCIVAEDTRVTSRLLALYGISRPLLVYTITTPLRCA